MAILGEPDMPIREYIAADPAHGCDHCRKGYEEVEAVGAEPAKRCPRCGSPVERQFSAPSVGASKSGLDDRARSAGFTKLKKLGGGEYEKKY